MKATVATLENTLQIYEGLWYLRNARVRYEQALQGESITPLEGPVVHAQSFREALLHAREREFDWEKYCFTDNLLEAESRLGISGNYIIPAELYAWTKHSRRVYQISPDLQALLAMTSPEELTWGDVKWPFQSFAIQLGTPLVDDKSKKRDFILVSHITAPGNLPWLAISIFTEDCRNLQSPITNTVKQEMEKAFQRKDYQSVYRKLKYIQLPVWKAFCYDLLILNGAKVATRLVKDSVKTMLKKHDKNVDLFDEAINIVIGLIQYLAKLPSDSSHRGTWQPVHAGNPDPRRITAGAEVCTVSTVFKLSPLESELIEKYRLGGLRQAIRELGAHYRSGYWHRPRGLGHDPEAEKTEWTHPTIVRKDRLKDGELPGGSVAVLKK